MFVRLHILLTARHAPRNRSYLHTLVYVLLVSLVFSSVFSTCAMPMTWRISTSSGLPEKCSDVAGHVQAHGHPTISLAQDCAFKPCPDSRLSQIYKVDKPEIPALLLVLVWVMVTALAAVQVQRLSPISSPPNYRRTPLIYQFCTLLN